MLMLHFFWGNHRQHCNESSLCQLVAVYYTHCLSDWVCAKFAFRVKQNGWHKLVGALIQLGSESTQEVPQVWGQSENLLHQLEPRSGGNKL